MRLEISGFGGIVPKVGRNVLPEGSASIADNCRVGSGVMKPLFSLLWKKKAKFSYGSMYWWKNSLLEYEDAGRRFVPGPVYGENQRLYMSLEEGGLFVRVNGVDYQVGCQEPTETPICTLTGNANTSMTKESRVYVYTHVNSLGEESAPSPPSSVITYQGHESVRISNLILGSNAITGSFAPIVSKRIYRLVTGNETSDYFFVGEISATYTAFTDNVSDVGEALSTNGWHVPGYTVSSDGKKSCVNDLKGLCMTSGGSLAAFHGQEVCVSVPQYPGCWPTEYTYSVEHDIVALASSQGQLFILTDGAVYYMSTSDLDNSAPVRMEGIFPCLSQRSVMSVPGGIIFPSRDGLYFVGSGYSKPMRLTTGFFDLPEWDDLNPSSMIGMWSNGSLYTFCTSNRDGRKGIIFNLGIDDSGSPAIQSITTNSVMAYDICMRVDNERIYIATVDTIYEWEGSTKKRMNATWQSKTYLLDNKTNFSSAVVEFDIQEETEEEDATIAIAFENYVLQRGGIFGGFAMRPQSEIGFTLDAIGDVMLSLSTVSNVEFLLYGNGEVIMHKKITSREPFTLPSGFTARTWYVRIKSNRDVRRIALAESMGELYG